jgi:hypothetical protein
MEQPVTFCVQPGQSDHVVQSTGANRRYPLHRKVTVDLDELGREERMEPVNDLRIEIRKRSTAEPECSVRDSSTIWRKPRSYRCHAGSAKDKFRIWYRVDTASPPIGVSFLDYITGEMRAFYPGDNTQALFETRPSL